MRGPGHACGAPQCIAVAPLPAHLQQFGRQHLVIKTSALQQWAVNVACLDRDLNAASQLTTAPHRPRLLPGHVGQAAPQRATEAPAGMPGGRRTLFLALCAALTLEAVARGDPGIADANSVRFLPRFLRFLAASTVPWALMACAWLNRQRPACPTATLGLPGPPWAPSSSGRMLSGPIFQS